MNGVCRKAILRRSLGLQLSLGSGGRVTGTYDGTRGGVARLAGRVDGQTLRLAITWPKPVNGDRKATMELVALGPNRLRQTVYDRRDGKTVATSSFTFTRR